jgi:DHA2 family multidrug resistance protein-like MFS transporter
MSSKNIRDDNDMARGEGRTADLHADGLATPRRWFAIISISLGTLASCLDSGMLNVALPTLSRELHAPPSSVVLLVTVYQLVMIMAVLPFSALGERIGLRPLYQIGLMVYAAATVMFFVADSLPAFIAVRTLQALGAAATFSVASAIVRSIYPQATLGRGIAINGALGTISASLAPGLGGILLTYVDWRWLFMVGLPIGLLSFVFGRKSLPDPHGHSEPYDFVAAGLCALTFGITVVGLESAVHGGSLVIAAVLVVIGVATGTYFIRRESRQALPVFPVDILRYRPVALTTLAWFTCAVVSMVVLVTLPFRLQHQYNYSPLEVGLVLASWPFAMAAAALVSGWLSDRISASVLGAIGMAITACGTLTLAFLPPDPSHFDLVWRMMLGSIGIGIFNSPTSRFIVLSAPRPRAAAAGGLSQTSRLAGQTVGATLSAALLALGVGEGNLPPLISCTLSLFALLCCLLAWRAARGTEANKAAVIEPTAA